MPKHDFVTIREHWSVKKKPLTEEELNEEFKKSNFKSHQAFLAWKVNHRHDFDVNFWEWMESTSTKYDEDGNVHRKRPGEPGLIYRWLLSETSGRFMNVCFIVMAASFLIYPIFLIWKFIVLYHYLGQLF